MAAKLQCGGDAIWDSGGSGGVARSDGSGGSDVKKGSYSLSFMNEESFLLMGFLCFETEDIKFTFSSFGNPNLFMWVEMKLSVSCGEITFSGSLRVNVEFVLLMKSITSLTIF